MKDFVTFEIAKKLKEKGFPQRPDYFNYSSYYDWDGLRKIHSLTNASVWFDTNISRDNIYFAPTISQALNWLREKRGLHICMGVPLHHGWDYEITEVDGALFRHANDGYCSYNEAALAGIEYVLDNLISSNHER